MVKKEKNLFKLNALYNVRDLGGLVTEEGNVTKAHKYIRGSAKGEMNEDEKAFFYQNGTKVVVDLRYTNEVDKVLSPLRGYEDIKYYNVDMMGEFFQMREQGYVDLSDLYLDLLEDSQDKIARVMKIFVEHENEGIYFHCTAGKDRTGIISMLLLDLIKVPREIIVSNYAESYENNKDRPGYRHMKEEWKKYVLSNPEYIERALDHVNHKYGSTVNYLYHIGLTEEDLASLRRSFLLVK